MATLIRAKQSLMGEYGKLRTGETGYCKASTAKELVAKGMAEIIDDNVDPPVKKIREHIFAKGYESKSGAIEPILNKQEAEDNEPEKAATKKEITEEEKEKKEQKETPKKQYK